MDKRCASAYTAWQYNILFAFQSTQSIIYLSLYYEYGRAGGSLTL